MTKKVEKKEIKKGEFITDIVSTYTVVNGVEVEKKEFFAGDKKVKEEIK